MHIIESLVVYYAFSARQVTSNYPFSPSTLSISLTSMSTIFILEYDNMLTGERMTVAEFSVHDMGNGISILEVRLERPISPDEMRVLERELPDIRGREVLIISGRMPLWMASWLTHIYVHLNSVLAFYDPKLNGAVVVASHNPNYYVGQVIPFVDSSSH